jgi:hypothetical protein
MHRVRLRTTRVHVKFTPAWKGPVEGWTVNFCTQNAWRFVPEHDFEDLYQEAYLLFMKLVEKYPTVVDPPHFMALFKRAVFNKLTTMATRHGKRPEVPLDTHVAGVDEDEHGWEPADAADAPEDQVSLHMVLDDAPAWVKRIVRQVGQGAVVPRRRRRRRYWREGNEQFLRRVGRVPSYISCVTEELKNLVTGEASCTRYANRSTSTSPITSEATQAAA